MKTLILITSMLFCSTLFSQLQFTNNGNLKIGTDAQITFYGNLVNNGAIIDSSLTFTFNGTVAQTIGGSSPTTFNNVIFYNNLGVTLEQPINVSGTLTLNDGLVNTSSINLLNMLNGSSTLVGNHASTSYINGPMNYQKSSAGSSILNFPIGKGADSRPIKLNVNHTGSTLYNYQTEVTTASARAFGFTLPGTINRVSTIHYWTITRTDIANTVTPSAGLSGNQTIEIFFGLNDSITDGNAIGIVKNSESNPTTWFDIGGMGGPTFNAGLNLTGSITSTSSPTAFNSFSLFTFGNKLGGQNPLPVELLTFDAKIKGENVALNWSTANEKNNSHFEIERSIDGINFEFIASQIAYGNGNSNTIQNYQSMDWNPIIGLSYYRLKQVDLSGSFKYSNIRSVQFEYYANLTLSPNPAGNTTSISISQKYKNGTVRIFDILGNIQGEWEVTPSSNLISLEGLKSGIYLVEFIIQKQETLRITTTKLIINK